jgi:hypothetical protein
MAPNRWPRQRSVRSFAKIEVRVAVFRIVAAHGIAQDPTAARGASVDSIAILAATAGAYLLAGFVKGVIGLGLPTVAIGLLGLLMTPAADCSRWCGGCGRCWRA